MNETGNAADLWLRSQQREPEVWDIEREYTELAEDYADLCRQVEELQCARRRLAQNAARLATERDEAAERAAAWEWAYREERARAQRTARWGARWRERALMALGAGSLALGRLTKQEGQR